MTTKFKIQKVTNQQSEYKMSLYELEGIPKAYSLQAQEVQRGREAKIQHLLAQVCLSYFFFFCRDDSIHFFGDYSCKVFNRQ